MSFFAKVRWKKTTTTLLLLLKGMTRSEDESFMLILSLDNRNTFQGVLKLEGHLGISLKYRKRLQQGLWPNTEIESAMQPLLVFKLWRKSSNPDFRCVSSTPEESTKVITFPAVLTMARRRHFPVAGWGVLSFQVVLYLDLSDLGAKKICPQTEVSFSGFFS